MRHHQHAKRIRAANRYRKAGHQPLLTAERIVRGCLQLRLQQGACHCALKNPGEGISNRQRVEDSGPIASHNLRHELGVVPNEHGPDLA